MFVEVEGMVIKESGKWACGAIRGPDPKNDPTRSW